MSRVIPLLLTAAIGGCTPLGIWMYEEPRVEVSEIAVDPSVGAAFPVQVSLSVSNANDFEVSLLRVRLRFVVGGHPIVDRDLSTAADFAARDRQVIRIGVAAGDLAPGANPRAAEAQPYTIDGYAILKTPIGERLIRFERIGVGVGSGSGLERASL
jgi:hypothetical protein